MILALRILYFEDLSVGMTETLSKTIAASDVVGFAQLTGDRNPIHLSEHFAAKTQFGKRIAAFAETALQGEPALVTRERHRQMLQLAWMSLAGALALEQQYGTDGREELIAEQVRAATTALERLTGRVDVEDILDAIFRDFCIGK